MDKYLNHLYALVASKIELTATRDIMGPRGKKLYSQGDKILPKDYLNHKSSHMSPPIPEAVTLPTFLSPDDIYNRINALIREDYYLYSIEKELSRASVLKECCRKIKVYAKLDEVLTLFSIEAPELFDQSLNSAYLADLSPQLVPLHY